MKTMKDYHGLYWCVLFLADIFEKFRNNSMKNHGLCPSRYLSAPGVNWNAMLKMTKLKPELIPDPAVLIFLEKCTRGEISYISHISNNKYLKSYDCKQELTKTYYTLRRK